ncbi:MAG: TetR/AcrR family transcriptional regulator [Dermatophilaceae bacterium]
MTIAGSDAAALPRHLQLLWGVEPEGRRGPRPSRTIDDIGKAAATIADTEGVAAVSMKRVAEALGFTTMSLYRYLDSKTDLLAVMSDCAAGAPTVRFGPRWGWRRRLESWAVGIAEVRRAHPWMADVPTGGPPLTPNLVAWMDLGLRSFDSTPLSEQQRFSALLMLDSFVSGHVRTTVQTGLSAPDGPAARDGSQQRPSYLDTLAMVLDPARFPALARGAPHALGDDEDEDFFATELRFGVAVVLDGVAALIERSQGRR